MAHHSLSDEDYQRFRDLILKRTGLFFGPRRRDALARAVLAGTERAGDGRPEQYYQCLQQSPTDGRLWDKLISTLTVGETYFFRNPAHFDALRHHILPELIARHRDDRRLRIWSAGCASGEEPYSIAILLRQLLPDIARWNVFILGSDINRHALEQAREGRYRAWSFRQTGPAIRERYFIPRHRLYEIKPEIRAMVTFAYLNLAEDVYPSLATNTNGMDLILCRNVAIYLPHEVTREIAARFYRCLVPQGWLIVGASETNPRVYSQFTVRSFPGATVYQKTQAHRATGIREQGKKGMRKQEGVAQPPHLPAALSPHSLVSPAPRPPSPPSPAPADAYQQGLALVEQGRDEDALQRFLTCIARDPDCAPAHYQIAQIHANRGQLEAAQSWCQQALERDPLLVEARYTLAVIHQEAGALDEAVAQLKKTLYLEPDFVLAHFSLANLYQQMGRRAQADRHRAQAQRLAAGMPPDAVVPGADGLTAGRLLTMVKAMI